MPFTPTDYLPYDFANRRHIGPSPAEMAHMLETLGLPDLESLIDETLPKSIGGKGSCNRSPNLADLLINFFVLKTHRCF